MFAYDVQCPKCGAKPLWRCETHTGWPCVTHRARWQALGIKKPTGEQLAAEFIYERKQDFQRTKAALAALSQ